MSTEDYKNIVRDNVILELNDDAPESKLLGIQIDIDLEDKSKVTDDIAWKMRNVHANYEHSSFCIYVFKTYGRLGGNRTIGKLLLNIGIHYLCIHR